MVVTDPSIDPITGLPVLNPSGPVQQIPLGQEVFPYADLNATAQPTRGPIYGDDIIPTSSLITAPDAQMKPRSVQATTSRELRVREAVFQNLGAAIPDGTTAPVDVNVVSGGGGGGLSTINLNHQLVWNNLSYSDNAEAFLTSYGVITTLYGITFAMMSVGGAVGNLSLANRATGHNLWSLAVACGSNGQMSYTEMFPYGIIPSADGIAPEIVDDLKIRTPFNDAIISFGLWWK